MEYEVKNGDGWYKIAKSQGIDVNELLALNNATLETMLHPGQLIKTSKPALVSKKEPAKQESKKSETPTLETTTNEPEQVNPMNPYGTYIAWSPTYKKGENCGVDGCAKYANDSLKGHRDTKGRKLYSNDNIGGHAWTRLTAGKDNRMIYSGYEGTEYDTSNAKDRENYQKYLQAVKAEDKKAADYYASLLQASVGRLSVQRNKAAADRFMKEFDSSTLDKNKTYMVNMYYAGSPNAGVAWYGAENGTTGTHTGNVYWDPNTERWRISHNVHGTVKDDDFIQTLGSRRPYAVTAIAEAVANDYTEADRREDYKRRKPIRGWIRDKLDFWKAGGTLIPKAEGGMELPEVTVTAINPNRKGISEEGKQFIIGLNNNRNHFMLKYGMSDQEYADLATLAVNLAQRESGLGSGKSYNVRKFIPDSILHIGKGIVRQNPDLGTKGNVLNFLANPAVVTGTAVSKYLSGQTGELSRGMTLIKYLDDVKNPELRRIYEEEGITDENLQTDPEAMARATISRLQFNKKSLQPKYHYTDGEEIPSDVAQAIYWNRGKLTDRKNPNITDLDAGGATGYARRFVNQKIL